MGPKRQKLIDLRKQKEWLQKDVVTMLEETKGIKISESYYGMIEQGVRTPSLNVALAISELFLAKPNEIFFTN
ncbi:helix-turn-helix transcriptional regulator [Niallia circulans]|uniref:helix-turn-helix transcriptional regulator n=1 Tax=Niallia circulans TaxID=1397 RepID=UPI00300A26E9